MHGAWRLTVLLGATLALAAGCSGDRELGSKSKGAGFPIGTDAAEGTDAAKKGTDAGTDAGKEGTDCGVPKKHDAGTDGAVISTDGGTDAGGTDGGKKECVPCGTARTKGYWANRGQSLIDANDLGALSALNLVGASGAAFDPATAAALADWLQGANAVNMAYMLSAQLAALVLNVREGLLAAACKIHAPGTTSADGAGYATVADIIAEANAALLADPFTPAGDPDRAYQEALKNAIDAANNQLNFFACDA